MIKAIRQYFSRSAREIAIAGIIIIIAVLVQIRTGGTFFTGANLADLFRETSILLMVSMAMMVVILTKGIDLSVGSTMGLSGMLVALILQSNHNIPLIVLFLIAIAIGTFCGLVNGFAVAKLHIYPLIATLATGYIFRGTIYLFSHGDWVPQVDMTPEFISVATTNILGINALIWIAVIITVLCFVFLRFTRNGRYIYAVGNSESSAAITGIKTRRVKVLAYSICGSICGLAGMLWVSKYGNAQSESCTGYEISIIAAVVLGGCRISGGVGTIAGVALGAILIGTLNNILPLIQVSIYWQMAIRGFIILISVIINAFTERNIVRSSLKGRLI